MTVEQMIVDVPPDIAPLIKIAYGRLFRSEVWARIKKAYGLSDREAQIAILATKGFTAAQIGEKLGLARQTVVVITGRLNIKCRCANQLQRTLKLILASGLLMGDVK